jgi:uncharacterized 2Fe-2S/4Fe-4S cluster protein (DUF4445 family)
MERPSSGRLTPHLPWKRKVGMVRLNVLPDQLWLRVPRGTTVWHALQDTDLNLEGDCGGLGKCGKCKVRIVSAIGPPCPAERELLDKDELAQGIRLACRTEIKRDMQIDVGEPDPEDEFNQILKTGRGRIIDLDPLITTRVASPAPIPEENGMADLSRIKQVLGPDYRDLTASLSCLRTLPEVMKKSDFDGAVVLHDTNLLAWRDWKKVGKSYGIAYDIGTTTLVGKLLSLLDTSEIAVVSRLNSQIKYGSDLISRLQFVRDNENGLQECHGTLMNDLNRITEDLLQAGQLSPDDIFISVAAGNTTMQHFLLELPPLGIAQAPFSPVLTDGLVVRAAEAGLDLHHEALLYVMPMRSGYVGGDMTGVILASGVMEQNEEIILGMDLGTNGEIFLGNRKRLLTCSAAAGPALEGARISHGMIAKTGAIEGVRTENGKLAYRIIGNTKPKGLCGSGLVDLVAVLVHCGIIGHDGLVGPAEKEPLKGLNSRVIKRGYTYDFLIASPEESYDGRTVFLTQKDVRELQLAKAAVAAGVRTLMEELGIGVDGIDRVHLAGALGNYVHPLSAMRIGLLPEVGRNIVTSLGNAALTGASMVLLSRGFWPLINRMTDSLEHVELSTRLDFNDYFVENMDFPDQNLW